MGSVTQPWVPHVGDIIVISGRIRIVMQVFCLWRAGVVRKAIMGMLSWFARLVLTEVGHGKVVVRGKGVMTMEGIIMLLQFFVRTVGVVVNRIKSCCNTFHGHIFTVFAGTCLKVHFRGFWMFCYWLAQAAFRCHPQEVCWEILYTAWVCKVGDKQACYLLVLDSNFRGNSPS